MTLSGYLKIWSGTALERRCLAFSTRKGAAAWLSRGTVDRLERGDIPEGAAESLTRLGFLVPDTEAETAAVIGYLGEVNRVSPVVRVAVILGMGCNFSCPYCYEGSLKGTDAMSAETAEQLVRFVVECLEPGKNRLTVDFYGGEPLLYLERARQIARALQGEALERGIGFSFTLVSNGSLLTPGVVEGLLPLGLASLKVTLDGPAEVHDHSRPTRSGQGTFAAIVENLRASCDRVPIGVGGNYTRETWPRFVALLDHLEAVGLGPNRLAGVKFDPVMQTTDRFANTGYCSGCASLDEPWLVEASLALREEILRRGYHTPKLTPTPCMVDRTDAFAVNWDGTLTKCTALIGHPEFTVGDIWRGFNEDIQATFGGPRWQNEEKCRACTYLPLCFGGCRYMQLQRTGTMAGVECQQTFLDATLEPMLRQDVAYRWGGRTSTGAADRP